MSEKIAVLGAGSFGTAMAHLLAKKGSTVMLWGRDVSVIEEVSSLQTSQRYITGQLEVFHITCDIDKALKDSTMVLFAVPCQALRGLLRNIKDKIPNDALIINLAKGIEIDTNFLPSEIFCDIIGSDIDKRYAVLSGPTFSQELYEETPSGAVVASASLGVARTIQKALSQKFFRLYAAKDIVGVELGGALKNIMAIGVGIAEGLGYGSNTRAGLITRCLHEMAQLGIAKGANEKTFSGLSGVGDLILTCTGNLSRNRQVGLRIGKGEKLDAILNSLGHVAEGVPTTKSLHNLNKKYKVDMPNALHVYKMLYEDMAPRDAVMSLLSRELKTEF